MPRYEIVVVEEVRYTIEVEADEDNSPENWDEDDSALADLVSEQWAIASGHPKFAGRSADFSIEERQIESVTRLDDPGEPDDPVSDADAQP